MVVVTTVASRAEADVIASVLVDGHLAACVQILGPIESRYRWEGEVETATEWLLMAKTVASRYGEVETAVRANHSYEEPEIVAWSIERASAGYLAWLASSTSPGSLGDGATGDT